MKTPIPSYLNKEFVIDDNLTLLRNPNNLEQFSRFKEGDVLPPGFEIGDRKLIPLRTKVKIEEVRIDDDRNVYVFAVPVDENSLYPSGWTRASNLLGKFINEIIAFIPSEWDCVPGENNCTVIDKRALIRTGPPEFKSTGEVIPVGTYVDITHRSRQTDPEGQYVKVSLATIEDGKLVQGDSLGWTASSNLVEGCSKVFSSDIWSDPQNPNAAWRSKKFIGSKILVGIVGTGCQMQHIALETLEAYLELAQAAKNENVEISVTSGFRTYAKQQQLYQRYKNGTGNLAATPGSSNHQNGIAFDLNTGGFDGSPVYDWMKKNATSYGFIRTVNKEHWHWEYRPDDAAALKKEGKFALARVRK